MTITGTLVIGPVGLTTKTAWRIQRGRADRESRCLSVATVTLWRGDSGIRVAGRIVAPSCVCVANHRVVNEHAWVATLANFDSHRRTSGHGEALIEGT